jgi:hypothetical protein
MTGHEILMHFPFHLQKNELDMVMVSVENAGTTAMNTAKPI